MEISINLRQVLRDFGLDEHGIINTLAAELMINRDTASKLCSGKASSISFAHLSRLCTWLVAKRVPAERLPAILFERHRATLWEALGRSSGRIVIYLGEYQSTAEGRMTGRWISRADSAVAASLIKELSQRESQTALPTLELSYVPFHFSPHDPQIDQSQFEGDIRENERIFNLIKHSSRPESTIIIGSQRVNYQLEYFLADLFHCRPFSQSPDRKAVPIFSVYRKLDQHTPSCFGGTSNPYAQHKKHEAGIHYLRDTGHWETCPWIRGQKDAAVIISVNDHEKQSITLAVFGYSGRATEAAGRLLITGPDKFWPPSTKIKRKEIGLYICKFQYPPAGEPETRSSQGKPENARVIPLRESVIRELVKS